MTFTNARQPFVPEWIARMRERRGRAMERRMEEIKMEALWESAMDEIRRAQVDHIAVCRRME